MKLSQRVAIVTGAGAGIGKAIAARFVREGATVVAVDIDPDALRIAAAESTEGPGRIVSYYGDVGRAGDALKIVTSTWNEYGALHVLVNNAAATRLQKPVLELTTEEWDNCIDVSLRSVFLFSKYAGPHLRDSGGGAILNIGSVGGTTAWAGGAAYCAAKAGILALTQVLAIEYGAWRIRVNTISPGAIMTPNLAASIERNQHLDRLRARSVLGRVGEADEVANVAAFLASDEASYITGANIVVDGGWLAK